MKSNIVYILGVPREYVPRRIQITLDGEVVNWALEISTEQRIVCAVHIQRPGILAVSGRLDHNVEAYLDEVQKPLTVPPVPNGLFELARSAWRAVLANPEKVAGVGKALMGP